MLETESTPEILPMFPQEMKELPQWVNWEYRNDTKTPVNPKTGGNAMVNHANTWNTFESAVERGARYNLGLGFVLTESDPFTCIDLDHCLGKGGVKTEPALSVVEMFKGQAYIEASPSRTGLHIWLHNEIPVNRRTPNLEIYSSGRWITCTGYVNPTAPRIETLPDATELVQELLSRFFPQTPPRTNYRPSENAPVDDQEIWDRLRNSKNGYVFDALIRGDVSVTHGDHSRGVIFLANMLAWITDGDAVRMERLLRQTQLGGDKFDSKRGNRRWIDLIIEDAIRYTNGRK